VKRKMLDINIRIEGDKVILEGLNRFAQEFPEAVKRGMERSAMGIHRAAYMFLSGPGAKGKTTGAAYSDIKTRKMKIKGQKWTPQSIPAGGYPVPVRSGHLRGYLDWLKPGQSKTNKYGTFTAGPNEAIIYDPVPYADVIHEGKWTSQSHGPRRYLTDAFEMFNRGLGIQMAISDEIEKAKAKAGLK